MPAAGRWGEAPGARTGELLASRVLFKIAYLLMRWLIGLTFLVLVFRGDRAKDAELLVLRHENVVLRRARRPRAVRARGPGLGHRAHALRPAAALGGDLSRHARDAAGLTPQTRRAKVRHEYSAQARPAAGGPQHRPPCRPAGHRKPAAGIPADPRGAHQARRHSRAFDRLGDPARRWHRSGAAPDRADLAGVPARAGRGNPRRRFPAR